MKREPEEVEMELMYLKAITTSIDPKLYHVPNSIANNGVIPVKVGLFAYIEVEIVLSRGLGEIPCRACKSRGMEVGRNYVIGCAGTVNKTLP